MNPPLEFVEVEVILYHATVKMKLFPAFLLVFL